MLRQERRDLSFPLARIYDEDRYDSRPVSHGYSHYYQLFNARQLYCLSHIYEGILRCGDAHSREYLLIAFSDCLASNNELVSYAFGYQKATPLFGIHAYQVPQRPVEGNVWGNPNFGRGSFSRCVAKMVLGKKYVEKPFEYRYASDGTPTQVFTGEVIITNVASDADGWNASDPRRACLLNASSTSLASLRSDSVDIILTDPPFYDNLPYSELSDFYYQWLRPLLAEYGLGENDRPDGGRSLLVKRRIESEHVRYLDGLTSVFRECARTLKPDGMLVFTFHHKDPAAWFLLTLALSKSRFFVTSVSPVRAEGVSGFHSYEGTPKWDAVITCRRSQPLWAETPASDVATAVLDGEKAWTARLLEHKLPWSHADRASFAFALTLRECVNRNIDEGASASLYSAMAKQYPQKGVAVSIPGQKGA